MKFKKQNTRKRTIFNEEKSNDILSTKKAKSKLKTTTVKIINSDNSTTLTTTTVKTLSVNATPISQLRIGLKKKRKNEKANSTDVSTNLRFNKKIGPVTFFGDENIRPKKAFDSARQGKDILTLEHFGVYLLPIISVNRKKIRPTASGEIDTDFEVAVFGQEDNIVRFEGDGLKIKPYNDKLATKFDPVRYVKMGSYVLGYPIMTDNYIDYSNFKNPDAIQGSQGSIHRDGAIEIFEIRKSLINTNPSDINIQGIRATFGVGDQEAGQISSNKGSSIVDSKYEIKQGKCDWFEDAQDLSFPDKVYFRDGEVSSGGYYMSMEGYISDGKYMSTPFQDKIINDDKYNMLSGASRTRLLLSSSNTNMSEIGTRFKSMQNGLIMQPCYARTGSIKTVLGVDSIAFRGLLKG